MIDRRAIYVVGVGMTRFGRLPELTVGAMGASAVRDALADAGIGLADLDVTYVGNALCAEPPNWVDDVTIFGPADQRETRQSPSGGCRPDIGCGMNGANALMKV